MKPAERFELIKQRLQDAYHPLYLEVVDDSHLHVGHAGSKDGAGHYTVIISPENFPNLSRVDIHRKIYDVLNDLIPHEIHALKIKLKTFFQS